MSDLLKKHPARLRAGLLRPSVRRGGLRAAMLALLVCVSLCLPPEQKPPTRPEASENLPFGEIHYRPGYSKNAE